MMRILINTPKLDELGGVSNYFLVLKNYFTKSIKFHTVGTRNNVSGFLFFPFDIIGFIFNIIFWKPDVIILNPSFGEKAVRRDAVYAFISNIFKINYIVFIHGWNEKFEKRVFFHNLFYINNLFKAKTILVLSSEYEKKLIKFGYKGKITLTTSLVNNDLLKGADVKKKSDKNNDLIFLFLARIIVEKGIFIAINAFANTLKNYPNCKLYIVGDGNSLKKAKNFVKNRFIKNVTFFGRLSGSELSQVYLESDVYLFPSYHGEGMPTSILEAMAFGLPVITTPNGGIKDFFVDNRMGYYINFKDGDSLVEKMMQLLENPELILEISKFNKNFAYNNFLASKVALDLEEIINKTYLL